jgi:DNA replication and repair protein RecF
MYLEHLSLTNFRSLARLDIDFPQGSVLLIGANAQGKTSLLEAIYFLATATSFHASHDRQLINFIAARDSLAVSRIVADYNCAGNRHRLEIRIILENNGPNGSPRLRKELLLDGVRLKSSEMIGKFNAVLFLPQMLKVIEGAPDERRRFINLACAQILPRYSTALGEYIRALTQRNALLKQLNERGGDQKQLDFWDEQMVESGAYLIYVRIQAIYEIERLIHMIHQDLTRTGEVLRLDYQPSFDPMPIPTGQYSLPFNAPIDRNSVTIDKIKKDFLECLHVQRSEEIMRGMTTKGPHRDEIRFVENGIDLGTYGSRGQIRTAILALKLAEIAWMHKRTGQWPVLLLDEVLAELDAERREDFLARLMVSEQVLLTTTDLDLFSSDFVEKATVWRVREGRLEQ